MRKKKHVEKILAPRSSKTKLKSASRNTTKRSKTEKTLQDSKDFYQAVMENTYFGFSLIDINYKVVMVDTMITKYFHKPASEIIGRECFREFEKRESLCPHCPGKRAMATGQPAEVETEGVRDDGSRFSVRIQTFPTIDSNGTVTGFIEIVEDITKLKKMEEVLRQSERKYRTVLESSQDAIYVHDYDGRYLYINDAGANFYGKKPDELIGRTLLELLPEERVKSMLKDIRRVYQENKVLRSVHAISFGEKVFHFSTVLSPISDESGNTVSVLGMGRDITDRKLMEEALRESEKRYRSLFEQAADSIVTFDINGVMVDFNKKTHENLGYSSEEFRKLNLADIDACESKRQVREHTQKIFKEGAETFETKHRTKNGQIRDVLVNAKVVSIGGRDLIQAVWSDITERKRTENALRESQELFFSFTDQFPGVIFIKNEKSQLQYANLYMKENLGADKWLGLVATDHYSHDNAKTLLADDRKALADGPLVKENILPDIHGNKRFFETHKFPIQRQDKPALLGGIAIDITERKRSEQKLRDYQARLKSLTSELTLAEERERHRIATVLHDQIAQSLVISKIKLDTLRSSAPSQGLVKELNEIGDLLYQTIQDIRSLTFDLSFPVLYELGFEAAVAAWLVEQIQDKYKIAFEFDDDEQPKPLDDDVRDLLFRNVRELLINVVKHANAKKVKVSIRKVDSWIQVSVEDDGVGFDVDKVFSTSSKLGGFGLFSIRERLEELGGHLEIDSKPGYGTRIKLMAPLKQ